ncbi:MAG: NnrS family protein, partial [Pseudomonadota bacterium]
AAAGNRRNLPVVALLALFVVGQGVFGAEVVREGAATYGHRVAIATALMLVMVIGGRVTPAFSTNWLTQRGATPLPAPFGRFDKVALLVAAAALCVWVARPGVGDLVPASLLTLAGVLHGLRLWRWRPFAVVRAPLLAALHCAYAFIPLGFVFAGAGLIMGRSDIAHGAVHIWTMGAIALMMLAIMTRASRGHTGRTLTAPVSTIVLYGALVLAVFSRVAATLEPSAMGALLLLAGVGWVGAFAGFALLYGPMLLSPRAKAG